MRNDLKLKISKAIKKASIRLSTAEGIFSKDCIMQASSFTLASFVFSWNQVNSQSKQTQ